MAYHLNGEGDHDKPQAQRSPYARAAPGLLRNGYSPIPITPGQKKPGIKPNGHWVDMPGWTRFCTELPSMQTIERWSGFDDGGVGVALGNGIIAVDIDTDDPAIGEAIESVLPEASVQKRGATGYTGFFRDPGNRIKTRRFRSSTLGMICEILAEGTQTVVPPTEHPITGVTYTYLTEATLENTPATSLPPAPSDLAEQLERALAPWLDEDQRQSSNRQQVTENSNADDRRMRGWAEKALESEAEKLAATAPGGRNSQLFSAACAVGKYVHHGVVSQDLIQRVLLAACQHCGLIKDDGPSQCIKTIRSGLSKAENDPLPDLTIVLTDITLDLAHNRAEVGPPCEQAQEQTTRPRSSSLRDRVPIWIGDLSLTCRVNWLIKNILGEGDLGVIYGEPRAGKTFFALDMAMHVALGRDWQGRKVRRGGVLYIGLEGWRGLQNRAIAQLLQYGEEVDANGQSVPVAVWSAQLDLCRSKEDVRDLIAAIHKLSSQIDVPISLVVIDTLARAMGGGDENAPGDMGALLRNIAEVQQRTGAHVLLVHHVGKDKARGPRGHSSLFGAVDTAIEVVRGKGTGDSEAKLNKVKDAEDGITFSFRLQQVELELDDDGDPITTCIVEHTGVAADSPSPKLSDQQVQAVELLHRALAENGEPASPKNSSIPGDVRIVQVEHWRDLCRTGGLAKSSRPDAARKAFGRVMSALQKAEVISVVDKYVWLEEPFITDGRAEA